MGDSRILYELLCILNEGYAKKMGVEKTEKIENIQRIKFYTRDQGFISKYTGSLHNYVSNSLSKTPQKSDILELLNGLNFELFSDCS